MIWQENVPNFWSCKGGLISESFSPWLKSPKIGDKLIPWESFLYKDIG